MCSTNNETPIERNELQILQNYALILKIFERISRGFIVKAGTKGSMQSLYLFLEEKN